MMKINNIKKAFMIVLLFAFQSCSKDFLEQVPSTQQSPESITIVSDAQIILNGAYDLLQDEDYYNSTMITRHDVRGDDMQVAEYGRIDDEYLYEYDTDQISSSIWSQPFTVLRQVNNIIAFIDNIETNTDTEKAARDEIKGQAYALRALAHFDLCKMFGLPYSHNGGSSLAIPIVTEVLYPDVKLSRNTVAEVYTQIISDLNTAIPLLSDDNSSVGTINAWAAKTLLARTYLYMEDNAKAYSTAVEIITNSPYSLTLRDNYLDSWSDESSDESIFSIVNSQTDDGGGDGVANLADPEGYGQFIATQDFINLMASDPDDIRSELLYVDQTSELSDPTTWGRVLKYPGKGNTKAVIVAHEEDSDKALESAAYTSNVPVFRLSEVYLIAAEAAIKNSDATNANLYLNAIVERANPLATVAEIDTDLDRILLERRKELVAEGHRFFDLIRNKKNIVRMNSDRVFDTATPLNIAFDNFQVVFPIPRAELNINPMTQNPGYIE